MCVSSLVVLSASFWLFDPDSTAKPAPAVAVLVTILGTLCAISGGFFTWQKVRSHDGRQHPQPLADTHPFAVVKPPSHPTPH